MKQVLLVLAIPFLLALSAEKRIIYNFIGYVDDFPVFFDETHHILIKVVDGRSEVIGEIDSDKEAIFIKNDMLVLQCTTAGNLYALMVKGDKEIRIPLRCDLTFITGDENALFYTDFNTYEIIKLSLDGAIDIGIKGLVVGLDKNYLYITQDNLKLSDGGPNVNVYRIDLLSSISNKEIVAKDFSGEQTKIFPGGRYIFDYYLHKGDYKPVVINTISNEIKFLNIPFEYSSFSNYLSIDSNEINFYNPYTLHLFKVDFEDF